MKNFKLISIDSGFDDNFKNSTYKQELQNLYLLLDKYKSAEYPIENIQINEPNLELIRNLVNSIDSLNELEFMIALKQIEKLEKPYPITISYSPDLSSHYKKYARIIAALKGHEYFKTTVKMLENKLNDDLNEDNTTNFISYINGLYTLLTYFNFNINDLWEFLKHYRQGKYIINFDNPLNYLNWHIEHDLFNELKEKGCAERFVNIGIFEFETAKNLGTIQLIFNLKITDNKFTKSNYDIGFEPVEINYRYIKTEWCKKYGNDIVDEFFRLSKPHSSANLKNIIQSILEKDSNNFEEMIILIKEIISLYNKEQAREIYKNKCKYKRDNHSKSCSKEFLTYNKRALFCYECAQNPDINRQTARLFRERKARL